MTGADWDQILERVITAFDARRQGRVWMARCPSHDDSRSSLQIDRGTDQPVVLTCFAGCDTRDVLAARDMTIADISSPRQARTRDDRVWTPYGDATAVYDYVDEHGNLLFQVLRVTGKRFIQRAPDPDANSRSGWLWRLGDTRRVLYRLPRLRPAIDSGQFIWIVEGEKDVHTLEALGEVATCNPGGAGKWLPEYAEVFRGAIVMIVADADKPGRAHARAIAASLDGIATATEIREAAEGKDVSDHVASGRTLAEMSVTRQAEPDAEPDLALDMNVFLAGQDPSLRWVIKGLLERGERLIWTGAEGLGKSMVNRQIAFCAALGVHPFLDFPIGQQRVLYIDAENPVRRSRQKFRILQQVGQKKGLSLPDRSFMIVHRPVGLDLTTSEGAEFLFERVTAYRPDLVVCGPLYKLHAVDANEEMAARSIVQVLDLAIAICGSALIIEAHSPHGLSDRTLRPVGSSLFLRWPDYGYGIKQKEPKNRKLVRVVAWRGPRDDRQWPRQLRHAPNIFTDWPWVIPPYDEPERGQPDVEDTHEEPPGDDEQGTLL